MTAIIILNWNGADDTLACLESLAKAKGEFRVYVVDNGSHDDSILRIRSWIDEHDKIDVRLLPLEKNYGFARGNNMGIAVASEDAPDSYLLLNNDTEVEPDFLTALFCFSASHPEYRVLTPKINYFYDKNIIWNYGGKLTFGFRKYYYAGLHKNLVKEREFIPISFVTGCALFFYPDVLDEQDRLFTERFFFGEEDFEFSMLMKQRNVQMACVLDSQIYHKVGASSDKMNLLGKLYLHYLNRFIDIRLHFNFVKYLVWTLINIPLVVCYFYRSSHRLLLALRLMSCLLRDAKKKDCVSQEDFNRLVLKHNYFPFKV